MLSFEGGHQSKPNIATRSLGIPDQPRSKSQKEIISCGLFDQGVVSLKDLDPQHGQTACASWFPFLDKNLGQDRPSFFFGTPVAGCLLVSLSRPSKIGTPASESAFSILSSGPTSPRRAGPKLRRASPRSLAGSGRVAGCFSRFGPLPCFVSAWVHLPPLVCVLVLWLVPRPSGKAGTCQLPQGRAVEGWTCFI